MQKLYWRTNALRFVPEMVYDLFCQSWGGGNRGTWKTKNAGARKTCEGTKNCARLAREGLHPAERPKKGKGWKSTLKKKGDRSRNAPPPRKRMVGGGVSITISQQTKRRPSLGSPATRGDHLPRGRRESNAEPLRPKGSGKKRSTILQDKANWREELV